MIDVMLFSIVVQVLASATELRLESNFGIEFFIARLVPFFIWVQKRGQRKACLEMQMRVTRWRGKKSFWKGLRASRGSLFFHERILRFCYCHSWDKPNHDPCPPKPGPLVRSNRCNESNHNSRTV